MLLDFPIRLLSVAEQKGPEKGLSGGIRRARRSETHHELSPRRRSLFVVVALISSESAHIDRPERAREEGAKNTHKLIRFIIQFVSINCATKIIC
jgi:hypothetical protein